jgi:hypothetical protein
MVYRPIPAYTGPIQALRIRYKRHTLICYCSVKLCIFNHKRILPGNQDICRNT